MVTFREIDRNHFVLRRTEAAACLHHGLNHAATLTACSGIELLLEFLVSQLHNYLERNSKRRARNLLKLVEDEQRRNNAKISYWGLKSWVEFYKRRGIFAELSKQFNYVFSTLNEHTLLDANEIWNKCKHDPYLASRENAVRTVRLLTEYLAETEIYGEANRRLKLTVGSFSAHWLRHWEEPLVRWVASNQDAPETRILLCLAPYLDLLIRLIDDERVTYEFKTPLMVAVNYVFSTLDLMPENHDTLEVSGLVDDGAVLTLTLHWLLRQADFEQAILYSHWPGGKAIHSEVNELQEHIWSCQTDLFPDSMRQFGSKLVLKILEKIAVDGPEALWQNYWKEAY